MRLKIFFRLESIAISSVRMYIVRLIIHPVMKLYRTQYVTYFFLGGLCRRPLLLVPWLALNLATLLFWVILTLAGMFSFADANAIVVFLIAGENINRRYRNT